MEQKPVFKTVKQFVESNPAFTVGGIRGLLFYIGEKAERDGVVVRLGRRVLINEPRFLDWVASGNARVIRGRGAA
jgi:hypothetical protein